MADWSELLALLGSGSIVIAVLVMGLLSKQLGEVTQAGSFYIGFFIAIGLASVGVLVRLINIGVGVEAASRLHLNLGWLLFYHGFPALGVTIALFITWYYWSWLLAERD